jgi:pantoate--beta-alanine ligase
VATVVLKLFQLVPADDCFFGQKDYQQARVIQCMVADLNLPVVVHIEPTVREPDGLAMSSRNAFLSAADRQRARGLWTALQAAQRLFQEGQTSAESLIASMRVVLRKHVDAIDYAAVVDPQTLEPVLTAQAGTVLLIAARVGATRLIDNWQLAD